jgi:hypothetical protein
MLFFTRVCKNLLFFPVVNCKMKTNLFCSAMEVEMVKNPVIILGAGATKACGGPLTDEILPAALNGEIEDDLRSVKLEDREELLYLTWNFMTKCFNVPETRPVKKEDCPNLPMILSMLRRSIELGQPIGDWQGDDLVKAKRAIEYAVFSVIEAALRKIHRNAQLHKSLLEPLYQNGIEPVVVSLNYDVIVDNTMFGLSERFPLSAIPDYGVDISTPQYLSVKSRGVYGRLYKIHGSLNWLYCEKCSRLDLFVSEGQNGLRTSKALDELYHEAPFKEAYSCRGTRCRNHPNCDGFVSPVLITPTYVKDYQNPHIKRVWQEAEKAMKNADKAIIIGYSLPNDDVEIGLLLKRGLNHLDRKQITVIEYVDKDIKKSPAKRTLIEKHPTGQRFRSLFGSGLDWHTTGFEGWLKEQGGNWILN